MINCNIFIIKNLIPCAFPTSLKFEFGYANPWADFGPRRLARTPRGGRAGVHSIIIIIS
jgi:hypothetical protein